MLYLYTIVISVSVEWCIGKPLSSSITHFALALASHITIILTFILHLHAETRDNHEGQRPLSHGAPGLRCTHQQHRPSELLGHLSPPAGRSYPLHAHPGGVRAYIQID